MKYLNLGCGKHYSTKQEWTNVDFVATRSGVIGHNLLKGIPFEDNTFDFVYHSHVLEHFTKDDGDKFISECVRVIKPGGIIRIAVPDLERIARNYLLCLEEGFKNPDDLKIKANYEWMLIEMFDQTVRSKSGGRMSEYLSQPVMLNEDFVYSRIGEEGKGIRQYLLSGQEKGPHSAGTPSTHSFRSRIKNKIKNYLLQRWQIDTEKEELGRFRLGGEIHQWMYDRYSLTSLLKEKNMHNIQVQDAFSSYLTEWSSYGLDGQGTVTRKPDSLFIEAIKN